MNFIRNHKPYFIFSFIILFGLAIFFVISGGYYPILSVNGRLISARTFWKNYRSDTVYYKNFVQIYQNQFKNADLSSLDINEVKRSVLTNLIENVLVGQEVEKELGNDLDSLVQDRINKINQNEEFKKTAEKVYGLNFDDFKNEVLIPVAKGEILSGRLFLQGKKLDEWLLSAKRASEVKVFSTQFYWDGKEVQFKK